MLSKKLFFLLLTLLVYLMNACNSDELGEQTGTLWAPFMEWSLENPSYEGNPFDLLATVVFKHQESGEERKTEMFYDGENTWKFRFTGTRTGKWTFNTMSEDSELNGKIGIVIINPNPNRIIKGFITSVGNKFARYVTSDSLEAFVYNIWQYGGPDFTFKPDFDSADSIKLYIKTARESGGTGIFAYIANQWFKKGALGYDKHKSENPDIETFKAIERMVTLTHEAGMFVHFWEWGDDAPHRKSSPVGVGDGINGVPDKRLQRYIAARLGPLPGWTMGYGFDLHEWVTEEQIAEWVQYMHEHMGWKHLLWGRERYESGDAQSYPLLGVVNDNYSEVLPRHGGTGHVDEKGTRAFLYNDVVALLATDPTRPHIFEERFLYQRSPWFTMDGTRRMFWQYTMAGGMGSWWGHTYPNPEQLHTHLVFWVDKKRFRLDMQAANNLSDGAYVLANAEKSLLVFYQEDCNTINMDLSGMTSPQPAVAVDTKKVYKEINIGELAAKKHSWKAPYQSDWAIAVGE